MKNKVESVIVRKHSKMYVGLFIAVLLAVVLLFVGAGMTSAKAEESDTAPQADSPQVGDVIESVGMLRFKCAATGADFYREFCCTQKFVSLGGMVAQEWTATADLSDVIQFYNIGTCSETDYANITVNKSTGVVTVENEYSIQFWENRNNYYFNLTVKNEQYPSQSNEYITYGDWTISGTYSYTVPVSCENGYSGNISAQVTESKRDVTVQEGMQAAFGTSRTEYKQVYVMDVSALRQQGYVNFRRDKEGNSGYYTLSSDGNILTYYRNIVTVPFASEDKITIFFVNFKLACDADFELTEVSLLEAPAKTGYTFVYWCTDEALQNRVTDTYVRSDMTLYPKYDINVYTLTFVTGMGKNIEPMQVEHFSVPTLPDAERVGYDFLGWATPDGEVYDTSTQISGPLTLVAKYKIKTFKLTFMNADGTVYKEVTVNYGTKLVDAASAQGLEFMRYYDSNTKEKLARNTTVESDMTVATEEMPQNEKVGTYITEHEWVLWLTVAVLGALLITAGVSIAVAVKRG